MKAKIENAGNICWWWEICYSNGVRAADSPLYTRRDNAIRGLRNFCDRISWAGCYELEIVG